MSNSESRITMKRANRATCISDNGPLTSNLNSSCRKNRAHQQTFMVVIMMLVCVTATFCFFQRYHINDEFQNANFELQNSMQSELVNLQAELRLQRRLMEVKEKQMDGTLRKKNKELVNAMNSLKALDPMKHTLKRKSDQIASLNTEVRGLRKSLLSLKKETSVKDDSEKDNDDVVKEILEGLDQEADPILNAVNTIQVENDTIFIAAFHKAGSSSLYSKMVEEALAAKEHPPCHAQMSNPWWTKPANLQRSDLPLDWKCDEKAILCYLGAKECRLLPKKGFKIVLLRDPIDRFVSWYNYVKAQPEHDQGSWHDSKGNVIDYESPLDVFETINGLRYVNALGKSNNLEYAKEKLREFDLIGILEDLNGFIPELKMRLPYLSIKEKQKNKGSYESDSKHVEELMSNADFRKEMELYNFAKELA